MVSGSPRPHLPKIPVAYPACLRTWATVVSSGRKGTRSPVRLLVLPRIQACPWCIPVISEHRDGAHTVQPDMRP